MDYDNSLDLIKKSGLLASDNGLADLKDELRATFEHAQMFRTDTEARVSVLNDAKFVTPDAKYWQAVREQDVFFTNLAMSAFDYQEKQVKIKRLERKLANSTDDLEQELLEIKIAREKHVLNLMEREACHRVRELRQWSQIKKELAPLCQYPLDDVNAHQLESYNARYQRQAQIIGNTDCGAADRINIIGLANTAGKQWQEWKELKSSQRPQLVK